MSAWKPGDVVTGPLPGHRPVARLLTAWLVTTLGLVIALGGDAWLAKENRRLRARLAQSEATRATALHIASERVQSQRGLRVVEGGAS